MALTAAETYKIAHTAQCKLRMSADRPDRNLRFLLGHAFTLDKLMLRIVEIEDREKVAADKAKAQQDPTARRVSFQDNSNRPSGGLRSGPDAAPAPSSTTRKGGRAPSPPPRNKAGAEQGSDTSSDDYDFDEDAHCGDLGLSLTTSHSALPPPHLVADDGKDDDEEDGPVSPPWNPTESELALITETEGDEVLKQLYNSVSGCGCQKRVAGGGEKAPAIEKIWEVPASKDKGMDTGRRTAIVAVAAA